MGDMGNKYKTLIAKSEGKRLPGRLKCRRKDNEINKKETVYKDVD
jgi:hypothetical protein